MTSYYKYKKYKRKYLQLAGSSGTNSYKFIHFDNNNEQIEFIKKNQSDILKIYHSSFPDNTELFITDELWQRKDIIENHRETYTRILNAIIESNLTNKWFFVIDNDKVIGFCFITNQKVYKIPNMEYDTYTIYKTDLLFTSTNVTPCIVSFCKDHNYKNVGTFLLNSICKYYKNKVPTIYLVVESILFKNNIASTLYDSNCRFDKKLYYESNMKLQNYYKKNGFTISKDLFDYGTCDIDKETNEKQQVVFYNVMYLDL